MVAGYAPRYAGGRGYDPRMVIRLSLRSGVKNLRSGHPWVFRDDDVRALGPQATGAVVDVYDARDRSFVARGLYDAESQIAVRLFTWDARERVDLELARRRLARAFELRGRFVDRERNTAYRLVNGEGDDLPGLVVDRYADFAVFQPYTALWLPWLRELAAFACRELGLRGALLKNRIRQIQDDVAEQGLEGVLAGEALPGDLEIRENGLRFVAAVGTGQKTGLFLDHRDNRAAVAPLCRGARVLNLFAYTGGFSVYAAVAGAAHVTSVDVAKGCAAYAARNMELNGVAAERHRYAVADAFDFLEAAEPEGFDVVILDPPTFATAKKHVFTATKGYERLIAEAARATRRGGVFVACSCTAQVSMAAFQDAAAAATARMGRNYRLIEVRALPHDHPTRAALPESRYLKCLIGVLE